MPTRSFDLPPHRRGDTIYVSLSSVTDSTGGAITLSNYRVRATLKELTDVSTGDGSALANVTSTASGGITVSGNSAIVKFPAAATSALSANTTLKYDISVTLESDTSEVRTLVAGLVPIEMDITKTSP